MEDACWSIERKCTHGMILNFPKDVVIPTFIQYTNSLAFGFSIVYDLLFWSYSYCIHRWVSLLLNSSSIKSSSTNIWDRKCFTIEGQGQIGLLACQWQFLYIQSWSYVLPYQDCLWECFVDYECHQLWFGVLSGGRMWDFTSFFCYILSEFSWSYPIKIGYSSCDSNFFLLWPFCFPKIYKFKNETFHAVDIIGIILVGNSSSS